MVITIPRTGRPTDDAKGEAIRIRLNQDMLNWLKRRSSATGTSVSQIIRDLIAKAM